jgi:hypothetical protein
MLLLAVAPAAEAAKRRVPQDFFGTSWDRDVASAAPDVQAGQWSLMARLMGVAPAGCDAHVGTGNGTGGPQRSLGCRV